MLFWNEPGAARRIPTRIPHASAPDRGRALTSLSENAADHCPARPSRVWEIALWVAIALAGAAMILLRTRTGPRISPDSVSYIAAARSLLAGKGLLTYNGDPYVDWPPLFPAAIAAVSALGVDAEQAARWIDALAFGAVAGASGWWVRRHSGLLAAGVAASAVLLRAGAMSFVAVFAWSEPLFLLFALLAVFALARYHRRGEPHVLSIAAALAACAVMTRYVGVALVATGVLVVVARPADVRSKLSDLLIFISISCAPYAAWVLRNARITATYTGGRAIGLHHPWENVRLLLYAVGSWIVTPIEPDEISMAVGAAGVIAITIAAVWLWRAGRRWDVLPPFAYMALYAALLLAMATFTEIDEIGDRLAVPLLPPAVLVLGLAVALAVRGRGLRIAAATVGLAVWLIVAPPRASEEVAFDNEVADYNMPQWHRSPMVTWLRVHPPRGAVFSNDPWALFERTRIPAEVAPAVPADSGQSFESDELQDVRDSVATGKPTFVVWFAESDGGPDPRAALDTVFAVTPLHREPDGALYLVRSRQ
jgi:hypothetical protein